MTSHIMDNELSNVKLIFFPSNTASVLQPLDQGIIKFKSFNRKNLISFIIYNLESNENCEEIKKLNILNGINFMKWAWSSIIQETIKNCFKHAFFDHPKTAPEIDFTEEWNKVKTNHNHQLHGFQWLFKH